MLKNISWSRGFFRLWVVYAFIVAIITGVNIYNEKPYMPEKTLMYKGKSDSFREARSIDQKDAFEELLRRGVINTVEVETDTLGFGKKLSQDIILSKTKEYYKEYQVRFNSKLQKSRMKNLNIGLSFLIIPLIIGLSIKWILIGFKSKEVADIPPSEDNQGPKAM